LWEVVRLAWLYWSGSRFYDSWNGLTSTCLQKSWGHYHLFTIDFPLTKGLRHIVEIPPIFFLKKILQVTFGR
jgi:hypothetical protein